MSRASTEDGSAAGSHEGVLTSLLNEMDGVQELVGVTIIAATNRPDVIVSLDSTGSQMSLNTAQDSALMRPGRLDRILYVGPPDQQAREEILKIRTRTMSVASDLDVAEIARMVCKAL